jgi:hypothetical protein
MAFGASLACLLLLGPRAQFSTAQSSQQTYSLRGTVVNSASGEPIHGALVQIYAERQRSQLTGPGGEFQFDNIPEGAFAVRVQKPGFFFPPELPTSRAQPIMVASGPDRPPAVIKLVPEGLIHGHVTGDNGEPIESLPVQLLFDHFENGKRVRAPARSASTDEQGEFRLAELQPGRYFVFFGPSSGSAFFASKLSPLSIRGYRAAFYPGVPDVASAAAIEITPGKHAEIHLTLSSQPFYRISGTVSGYLQNQGINLQITNAAGQPMNADFQLDPVRGVFRTQWLPAGPCTLTAHMQDPATQQEYLASQDLNLTSDLAGVHLALVPNASIPVKFQLEITRSDSQREPVGNFFFGGPGGMQKLRQAQAQLLLRSHNQPLSQQQRASEPVGEEGNAAVVRNVPPGVYSVEVQPFGPYYAQSVRSGPLNLLEQNLTVVPGASLQPIEVLLRDDFATLDGSVSSDSRDDPAAVLIIPEGTQQPVRMIGLMRSGPTIDSNRPAAEFTMPQLPPGNYKVLAVDTTDFEYANPAVLQKYLSKAKEISLAPNQQAKVKLELVHIGD